VKRFEHLAAAMDLRVAQLACEGVRGAVLLDRMATYLPQLHRIWIEATDEQLASLSAQYPGFYQYALLMEEAFAADRPNPHEHPQVPLASDKLKSLFEALMKDASTLELEYQSVQDNARRGDAARRSAKLNGQHDAWMKDFEGFKNALRAEEAGRDALQQLHPTLDAIAQRIEEARHRVNRDSDAGKVTDLLPRLTINGDFVRDFSGATAPCFALGLLQERKHTRGFFAIRTQQPISRDLTELGMRFGHSLLGSSDFAVVHFAFEFYGFGAYNALVKPHDPVVRAVLQTIVQTGTYFVIAIDAHGSAQVFGGEMQHPDLAGLKTNLPRILASRASDQQYDKALAQFRRAPHPQGWLLDWVCRDDVAYMDLDANPMNLTPSRQ
jgi:hypothetical protein